MFPRKKSENVAGKHMGPSMSHQLSQLQLRKAKKVSRHLIPTLLCLLVEFVFNMSHISNFGIIHVFNNQKASRGWSAYAIDVRHTADTAYALTNINALI